MSEQTINHRLRELLLLLKIKPGRFSRELGLSETTVRNYIDRTSKPSSEVLEKIVRTYSQVNLVWLVTGLGDPFLEYHKDYELDPQKNEDNMRERFERHDDARTMFQDFHDTIGEQKHELDMCKKEAAGLLAQLKAQSELLASKDALIAAKDEMLALFREALDRQK